ncbi:hypothetical protein [Pontibacter oryzae]|nr:hypothetical protein [Pontibacter oryzae]
MSFILRLLAGFILITGGNGMQWLTQRAKYNQSGNTQNIRLKKLL